MYEKGRVSFISTFKEVNRIYNIREFEEETDEEKTEGDEGSKEIKCEDKDLEEKEDEGKSDKEILSVTVIEQESDEGELRKYSKERVSENLEIEELIKDLLGDGSMDNYKEENEIGPKGDRSSEEMIKGKIEERNKGIEEEKGMNNE